MTACKVSSFDFMVKVTPRLAVVGRNALARHFGHALAVRIAACAMLMPVYEDQGMSVAVRYTIGALKRMRQQGTKKTTWTDVVDRLENEQVESRHYSMGTALSRDIKRIETWNKQSEAEHKAASFVIQAMEAEQARYDDAPEEQLQVKLWVAEYMANVGTRKSAYLIRVMKSWSKGKDMGRKVQENIRVNYAPRGVEASTFIEMLVKYA